MTEAAHFNRMPDYMRAEWVRKHGRWPGEKEARTSVKGVDPALAREITEAVKQGLLSQNPEAWKVLRGEKLMDRLTATGKLTRPLY